MKAKWVKVTNKRLYNGFLIDVKSYELEKAQRLNIPIKVYIKDSGRWVTILPEKFSNGEYGSKLWKSKYKNGKPYYLVSFSVRTDAEKEEAKKEEEKVSATQGLFSTMTLDRLQNMKKQIFKH